MEHAPVDNDAAAHSHADLKDDRVAEALGIAGLLTPGEDVGILVDHHRQPREGGREVRRDRLALPPRKVGALHHAFVDRPGNTHADAAESRTVESNLVGQPVETLDDLGQHDRGALVAVEVGLGRGDEHPGKIGDAQPGVAPADVGHEQAASSALKEYVSAGRPPVEVACGLMRTSPASTS